MNIGICKSCGARIRWAVTEKGSKQPFDADPDSRGNVTLHDDTTFPNLPEKAQVANLFTDKMLPLYMPHHATCAFADQWRKR